MRLELLFNPGLLCERLAIESIRKAASGTQKYAGGESFTQSYRYANVGAWAC
jgi:hypothetical protein